MPVDIKAVTKLGPADGEVRVDISYARTREDNALRSGGRCVDVATSCPAACFILRPPRFTSTRVTD